MIDWQPEQRLWQAVINQALHDACNDAWREELHKREALHFFLDKAGGWKASRDIISDVCGYDPSYITEMAQKKLAEKNQKYMRSRAHPDKIKF